MCLEHARVYVVPNHVDISAPSMSNRGPVRVKKVETDQDRKQRVDKERDKKREETERRAQASRKLIQEARATEAKVREHMQVAVRRMISDTRNQDPQRMADRIGMPASWMNSLMDKCQFGYKEVESCYMQAIDTSVELPPDEREVLRQELLASARQTRAERDKIDATRAKLCKGYSAVYQAFLADLGVAATRAADALTTVMNDAMGEQSNP
jgi:hypothetical protein